MSLSGPGCRWRSLLAAVALWQALAVTGALAYGESEARQALELCGRGRDLLGQHQFSAAADVLRQALRLAPDWPAPHGVLGVVYQQQWYEAGAKRTAAQEAWRTQALAEYQAVQRAGLDAVYATPQEPPWVEHAQVLAPARGLLGGTVPEILRASAALAGSGNGELLPLSRADRSASRAPQDAARGSSNGLPPSRVRPNDIYLRGKLKGLGELVVCSSAAATWEVNNRRLMSAREPVIPDAYLVCLAQAFAIWTVRQGTRQHKWRQERFQKAFPDIFAAWNLKETLAWADSMYDSYVFCPAAVVDSIKGFFDSPEHAPALLDPRAQYLGAACAPTHSGSYVVQVEVVGPPPSTQRPPGRP